MGPSNSDNPPPPYQASRPQTSRPVYSPPQPRRPPRNWKADIETGFKACCCYCGEECRKGFCFFILAVIVNAAIAGIYVGLIALYEHFRFTNPYGVGPGEVLPGALTCAIILQLGGLALWIASAACTGLFFDREEYCAGVASTLATLFFMGVWIFNVFEGWKYNLLNLK
jgi:hypothetical protein